MRMLNPMIRKELLVNVRSPRVVITMVVFNAILALIGLIAFYQVIQNAKMYGSIDYNSITMLYVLLIAFEALLLALIVPALTAGAVSGERERQTLDILLTSSLSPWSIVSGKLISCILSVILLIVSSVPVLSLIYVFGGIGFWEMFQTVLMLVYIAFFGGCIGIFCSCTFKKTTSATVGSYGLMLAVGVGSLIVAFVITILYMFDNSDEAMLVMLINPAVTLVYLLMSQLGEDVSGYGTGFFRFAMDHWVVVSLAFQTGLLTLLLVAAKNRVDPLRKGRKRR